MQTGEWVGGARILGTAGRGAMGMVYRAHQATLDRVVAIKVVASEHAADPEFRARFQREARAAGALHHPHIVAVYDAGEDHGRLYLTMQYVEGRDLASMLREFGPMPPADAVVVVEQIASALDVAHAHQLVHRDVKPANIMVTRQGRDWHAYLTDFGITTRLGEAGLTRTGLALGTLDYMAPEQLVGDPYDHRADVYALGSVLYQVLTGAVPFPRETDAARIYAHLNDTVPQVGPMLPPEAPAPVRTALSAVVARALAKHPDARFDSAGALAEAARAALQGDAPTNSRRGASGSKPYRPVSAIHGSGGSRPGRRGVLLGAAAVLAVGTGGAVAARRLTGDEESPAATTSTPTRLGLPDDVAAAVPHPRTSEVFKVGESPGGIVVSNDIAWVNNLKDRSMTRIDLLASESRTIALDGTPHDFFIVGGRVWVALIAKDNVRLQAIDAAKGEVEDLKIPLTVSGAGVLSATPDGRIVWLSHEGELVRIDLAAGREVATTTVGGMVSSISLSDEHFIVRDRVSHRFHRLDPDTGKKVKPPLEASPDFRGSVLVGDKILLGSPLVGYGELVGDTVPSGAKMHLKNYSVGVFDEKIAWGIDITNSEFSRLTVGLTKTIGAPVKDLAAADETQFDSSLSRLCVLDPTARTVRVFAVTPLRKL